MTVVYLVQHGEKESLPGDPGLTARGRQQATRTGRWLRERGVQTLRTSPLRRARETAGCIAAVTGLTAQPDARLRERLNWDGTMPLEAFLALWARMRHDRDFAPGNEESSRQAGARLQAFLAGLPSTPGPVAAVTHGGITTDLLCNLLGDDALPSRLLDAGIPPCAITAVDDLNVVMIASVGHLSLPPP
jgi:broad specificity phosphatase PhoE